MNRKLKLFLISALILLGAQAARAQEAPSGVVGSSFPAITSIPDNYYVTLIGAGRNWKIKWSDLRNLVSSGGSLGANNSLTLYKVYADAVNGDDSQDGTAGKPVKTLTKAEQLAYANFNLKGLPGAVCAVNGVFSDYNLGSQGVYLWYFEHGVVVTNTTGVSMFKQVTKDFFIFGDGVFGNSFDRPASIFHDTDPTKLYPDWDGLSPSGEMNFFCEAYAVCYPRLSAVLTAPRYSSPCKTSIKAKSYLAGGIYSTQSPPEGYAGQSQLSVLFEAPTILLGTIYISDASTDYNLKTTFSFKGQSLDMISPGAGMPAIDVYVDTTKLTFQFSGFGGLRYKLNGTEVPLSTVGDSHYSGSYRAVDESGNTSWYISGQVFCGGVVTSDNGTTTLRGTTSLNGKAALALDPPYYPTSDGITGQIAADSSYLYYCVTSGDWRRVPWVKADWNNSPYPVAPVITGCTFPNIPEFDQVTVYWTEAADPQLDFIVSYADNGVSYNISVPASARSYTMTGLTSARQNITVTARNSTTYTTASEVYVLAAP
jgi:hypothetical protein